MIWWCHLAALVLVMGIVLSPLRAVAATVPMLFAYDVAVRPGTTTIHDAASSRGDALRINYKVIFNGEAGPTYFQPYSGSAQ